LAAAQSLVEGSLLAVLELQAAVLNFLLGNLAADR
jgi:hypothetical protein